MNRIALLTAVLTAAGAALQAVESTAPPANSSELSSQPPVSGSHEDRFHREIAPLLGRACGSCHDPDTQEGGVVLTTLVPSMDRPATVALWKKARKLVPSRTMPPADAEQLSAEEIATLTSWIDEGFAVEAERLRVTTSRLATRRLTNREFNRSLLHLVGAESSRRDFTAEENIPADAVDPTGFSNDARANPLTKTHLEAYRQAARAAFREFAPFVEKSRSPLRYFYHGEYCYTSRATQDHVFDFVKNVAHPLSEGKSIPAGRSRVSRATRS